MPEEAFPPLEDEAPSDDWPPPEEAPPDALEVSPAPVFWAADLSPDFLPPRSSDFLLSEFLFDSLFEDSESSLASFEPLGSSLHHSKIWNPWN